MPLPDVAESVSHEALELAVHPVDTFAFAFMVKFMFPPSELKLRVSGVTISNEGSIVQNDNKNCNE